MKEKIFKMIQSGDREMVILGMITAVELGEEWCHANIPCFGIGTGYDGILRTNCDAEKGEWGSVIVSDGDVILKWGPEGYIDARLQKDFETINLEKDYEYREIIKTSKYKQHENNN